MARDEIDRLRIALEEVKKLEDGGNLAAEDGQKRYGAIIEAQPNIGESAQDDLTRIKEDAIYRLANLLSREHKAEALAQLNRDIRPVFTNMPRAKTAKIVRTIIELVGKIPNTLNTQIAVCRESVEWARKEKRNFLRQRIESRLASLLFENDEFSSSLQLIEKLLKEMRRLDDKALLVEIHLLESHVHTALHNHTKAKAALTAARSAANAIYCPPLLQAEMDLQSGILHAEDKDYKTAYSYFFEAFEGYNVEDKELATRCLKYMLLCKIMTNQNDDVQSILSSKNALKYGGDDVEAMRGIAHAAQTRSLHAFEEVLNKYPKQLREDSTVESHLSKMYDSLLESHLLRIIEPFSRVEVSHVAKLIDLPRDRVEKKLSQMILDKTLHAILDQGHDCLIVFDEDEEDKLYPAALSTIDNLNTVVDSLFERARALAK